MSNSLDPDKAMIYGSNTGLDNKNCKYFLTHTSYVLGAQKNHLIETVLLSTHNICFGLEMRDYFSVTHS